MTEQILSILRIAGQAIMEIYSDESLFATEIKDDRSPLTAADRRANQIISEGLSQYFPETPVISEESRQIDYKTRSSFIQYFLVDPLDGTKEFIKRNGEFTINIAYMENTRPVAGFILIPVTQTAYIAHHGNGAFRINADGMRTTLRSNSFNLSKPGVRVYASRSHRDENTMRMIYALDQPEIMTAGSALKFMRIAEGEADFYPRFAPTMEWDTAAAQCILEEAGGSILRADSLLPLSYNKESLVNPHFIATGALLDPESLRNMIMPD